MLEGAAFVRARFHLVPSRSLSLSISLSLFLSRLITLLHDTNIGGRQVDRLAGWQAGR